MPRTMTDHGPGGLGVISESHSRPGRAGKHSILVDHVAWETVTREGTLG